MTRIIVNGECFEVHKSKYAKVENLARYCGRLLSECYDKPSPAKQRIWERWLMWAQELELWYFGVSSYNTFSFTLQGLLEYDGHLYILSITPAHNYAYIVE